MSTHHPEDSDSPVIDEGDNLSGVELPPTAKNEIRHTSRRGPTFGWAVTFFGVLAGAASLIALGLSLAGTSSSDSSTTTSSSSTTATVDTSSTSTSTELAPDAPVVTETTTAEDVEIEYEVTTFAPAGSPVTRALLVTSDERLIAVGDRGLTPHIWDLDGDVPVSTYPGHGSVVLESIVELPDGTIATGGEGGFQVWKIGAGSFIAEKEHGAAVLAMAALQDGRVITGQAEGMIRAWSLPDTSTVDFDYRPHLQGGEGRVDHLLVTDSGSIVSAGDNGVFIAQAPAPTPGNQITLPSGEPLTDQVVADLGQTIDGKLVLAGPSGQPSVVRMLDPANPANSLDYEHHDASVTAVAMLPSGKLATGDESGAIQLWFADDGSESEGVDMFDSAVVDLAATPEGDLAVALENGQVIVINL